MMQRKHQGELVSVVMSAYNHAPYVGAAIESVLCQSHENLEFLITDDGSTDGTVEEIKKYRDKRIQFIGSTKNRGACATTNELIKKSSGQYICIMNSDDIWHDKLKITKQLQCHLKNTKYGAVFAKPSFIDRQGNKIDKETLPNGSVFDRENRNKAKWLEELFMRGNCLCHPSVMIRKECYKYAGLYNNIYRQLPDYDMWIKILKLYEIHILEEEVVSFRILPGESASSYNINNTIRDTNENYIIRKRFFDHISVQDFEDGFGQYLKNSIKSNIIFKIEKALLYIGKDSCCNNIDQLIGLEKIAELLESNDTKSILEEIYHIDDKWFHGYAEKVKVFYNDSMYGCIMENKNFSIENNIFSKLTRLLFKKSSKIKNC
jgi:glycosyltransferase involved in cell wall biosynthesis